MAMKSTDQALSITDDSGLLAIVDVAKYAPFVGEDWTYEQMLDHFAESTAAKTILLWECGDGCDEYCVAIRSGFTTETCFREMSGAIEASASQKHSRSRRTSSSPGKIQSESRSRRMDSAGSLCSAIVGGMPSALPAPGLGELSHAPQRRSELRRGSFRFAQCQQIGRQLFGLVGLQIEIHLVREVVGLTQPAAGRRVGTSKGVS